MDDISFGTEIPEPNDDAIAIGGTKTVTIDELPKDYTVTISVTGQNGFTAERNITLSDNGDGTYSGDYAIPNIPIDANTEPTFTVTETVSGEPSSDSYTVTHGGSKAEGNNKAENFDGMSTTITVSGGKIYTVNFTNTYTAKANDLTITKTITGVDAAALETLKENMTFAVTQQGGSAVSGSPVTLKDFTTDEAGTDDANQTYKFTYTFEDLPIGTYTVTESDYELTDSYSCITTPAGATQNVNVTADNAGTADFTNVYIRLKGTLTVDKDVTGIFTADQTAANAQTFTVTITGPADAADDDVSFTDANGDSKSFVLTTDGNNAEATGVAVKVGTNVVINNLPTGSYTVTEQNVPVDGSDFLDGKYYYTASGSDSEDEVVLTTAGATATITNSYKPYYSVTIEKKIDGEMGSKSDWFKFTVTGDAEDDVTITATDSDVTARISTTNKTFELKDSTTVTIGKLKDGDSIVVTENVETGAASGYSTSINASDNGDAFEITNVGADGVVTITVNAVNEADADLGTVVYTNKRLAVAPTGLESNHTTPYVLMITAAGMAGLALIGGIVARRIRRRRQE